MVDVAGYRTINDLLDEREQLVGARPAVTFESRAGDRVDLSYGELAAASRRIAGGLRSVGVRGGDAVVVHLPNSAELLLTWFRLAPLGAVMVPSNPAFTAR